MKKNNVHTQKGIAQLVILSIMGVLAIVLPVATKLVQQNQENRSQAATATTCSKSTLGAKKCNSTAKTISVCKSVKNMDDEYEYIFTSPTSCTYGCTQSTSTTATCNSAPAPTTAPTKICTPNAYICNNSTLKKCNSDGTATSVIQPCSKGCNSSGNACLACTANEKPICTVDGKVGVCSSGNWDYKTCPSGQVCSGGACVTIQVCTPRATKCESNVFKECNANGTAWSSTTCTSSQNCNTVSGCVAKPAPVKCTINTSSFDVGFVFCNSSYNQVWTCKSDGTWGKSDCLQSETCPTGKTDCVAKSVCTANTQYKCNGKILEQCNSSGTGWTTKQTCGTNESCYADEKECRKDNCPTTSLVGKVLTPGQKACGTESTNKNYLYTCNAGNDVTRDVCPGTCSNGACVAAANKINGLCNEKITAAPTSSACLSGTFKDQPDYSGHWVWDCEGANGGTTAHCNITTVAPGCNAANVGAKKCNATTKTITTCKSVKNMEGEFEYIYTSPVTCSSGCVQVTPKDAICNSTSADITCIDNSSGGVPDYLCPTGYYCDYLKNPKLCKKGCDSVLEVGYGLAYGNSACGKNPGNKNMLYSCSSSGSYLEPQTCSNGCVQETTTTAKCNPSGGNPGGGNPGGGNPGGGDTGGGETPATLTGIKLSPNPLYLAVGKSWKVDVETIPGGLSPEYMWKSDNAKIASVDMLGNVKGVTLGETYITATAKGTDISDKIKVVVDPDGSVTPEACTGYVYDEWSDCKNGTQTRNLLSKTPDGCTGNPSYAPVTTQECSDVAISYKIAFAGILPGAKCIDEYLIPETRIETDVANVPSIASGKYTDKIQTSFEETDETDSKGNRIFQVTNLVLDKDKFGSVNNFNYVKVKGPWHLKRRMCQDGQGKKMPESTACDINLKANSGKVYDFSEYTLLAGDITADGSKRGDGVINSLDLGYIKTRLNPGSGVNCGREGDLNMDGVVNSIDLNLVKTSLTERDDE